MPDIAASDVTYTQTYAQAGPSDPRPVRHFDIAFGNGTLTYPTGGIPLDRAKLGCPTFVNELIIMDAANANGFLYKWDRTNNKIRIFQGDNTNVAAAPGVELAGGSAAPAAATLKVYVKGH